MPTDSSLMLTLVSLSCWSAGQMGWASEKKCEDGHAVSIRDNISLPMKMR